MVPLKAVERQIGVDDGRPKTIGRPLRSGVFHAGQHGSIDAMCQVQLPNITVAGQVRSHVRRLERPVAIELIMSWFRPHVSNADMEALLDVGHKELFEVLNGRRPWPAEYFVVIAKRAPKLGELVVMAYSTLLPLESIGALAAWFNARFAELKEAAAC